METSTLNALEIENRRLLKAVHALEMKTIDQHDAIEDLNICLTDYRMDLEEARDKITKLERKVRIREQSRRAWMEDAMRLEALLVQVAREGGDICGACEGFYDGDDSCENPNCFNGYEVNVDA